MSDVVQRAKAALEGVTEGPWELIHRHDGSAMLLGNEHRNGVAVDGRYLGIVHEPDAEFIAAARNEYVPDLIAEVERLESELRVSEAGNALGKVAVSQRNAAWAEVERLTPRRIETVAELDALPSRVLVRADDGDFYQKLCINWDWDCLSEDGNGGRYNVDRVPLPAIVLFTPDAAS